MKLARVCFVFISLVVILFLFCYYTSYNNAPIGYQCTNKGSKNVSIYPVIAVETQFFKHSLLEALSRQVDINSCPQKCLFFEHGRISTIEADVYLYHLRNVKPEMEPEIRCRKNSSVQLLLTMESPAYSKLKVDSSLFDYVISYLPSLGMSWPYDYFEMIGPGADPLEIWTAADVTKAVQQKVKPILILVSHCSSDSGREKYIETLSKHIPITNYGDCSGINCDDICADKAYREHYFYLALENSVCNHYVTEKFWNLKKLIVPIVLSRKSVANTAPSHSFIAIDDFDNMAELAGFLYFLMENKEEYSRYFQWTTTYKKTMGLGKTACSICDFAWKIKNNTDLTSTTGLNYGQWIEQNDCKKDFVPKLMDASEFKIDHDYGKLIFVAILCLFGRQASWMYPVMVMSMSTFVDSNWLLTLISVKPSFCETHFLLPRWKMILCICFLLPFLTLISGQFGTSTVSTTTTTTTPMPFTTTSIFGGLLSSTMTPAAFTLSPGTVINATIITQRPDEAAFNSMISGLPSEAQNQVRNIRGNIFLTLVQQDQQITEILNAQGGSYSTVYNDIKNAVSLQAQNISTSMSSLTASAQSFVSRRQMVMNNTAIALFDFNGRLGSLASEFNGYSDSLKNEIYNFLVTHPLNGSFTVVMSSTTTTMMPPVSLNSTIENFIMSSVFLDGTTLPVKSFVDLLPQAQQTEFNNIINGNNRKDQIMTQLVQLVTGWGPQYAAAFNNTMTQRDQMMQSFMFLSGGLSEPYKTFVNRKLALMNNMTLTPTQESQSMQALISSFTAAKNALNQFTMSSSTPAPIFGR